LVDYLYQYDILPQHMKENFNKSSFLEADKKMTKNVVLFALFSIIAASGSCYLVNLIDLAP